MAPVIIPEGFVLVKPRSRETAIALLEAADAVKADRHLSVRTVTGGYHVAQKVAEKYQESFPEADVEDGSESQESVDTRNQAEDAKEAGQEVPAGEKTEEELAPLPVTAENSHAEIDAYASSLDPKVEFPKDTNKADKIALLEAARKPQTPAE